MSSDTKTSPKSTKADSKDDNHRLSQKDEALSRDHNSRNDQGSHKSAHHDNRNSNHHGKDSRRHDHSQAIPLDPRSRAIRSAADSVAGLATLIIYLVVSFLTGAWHLTWIIWLLFALARAVVSLVLVLQGKAPLDDDEDDDFDDDWD